ncbi:MAG: carbohydrate ABC transporter permease [Nitrososphaerales archaeon]
MVSKRFTNLLTYLGMIFAIIFFLFPPFWMVITSIKFGKDVFEFSAFPFLQFTPSIKPWYTEVVIRWSETSRALFNSTVIGLGSASFALFIGSIAGYAITRFQFQRWKNIDIITWFFSLRILPPISLVIPYYALMRSLNLLDLQLSVILIHSVFFLPYAVLVTFSAFKAIPVEVEESALIDGLSRFQAFRVISLRLISPVLAAVFILILAFSWNEFLMAFILTSKNSVPMTVHIAGTITTVGVHFWTLSVRQVLAFTPPFILALLIQKYIVSGLTLGAIKG